MLFEECEREVYLSIGVSETNVWVGMQGRSLGGVGLEFMQLFIQK